MNYYLEEENQIFILFLSYFKVLKDVRLNTTHFFNYESFK